MVNDIEFTDANSSHTLRKLIRYTDKIIKHSTDADNMFTNLSFINLIIDEDQINTSLGGDGAPILKEFINYLLPLYLPLLKLDKVESKKIFNFYKDTEICWDSIDEETINHFNIKRFFTNMQTNFFDTPPKDPSEYDNYSQPEEYIYSIYYKKLEETNELLLNTSYEGHATSVIIKKINEKHYEVNIINTNDGEYSENYQPEDNTKGHFGIKCRGIMTLDIKDVNSITAQKRILKFIYFFSNYYHFMVDKVNYKGKLEYIQLFNSTFYQKIIPLLLINDDANLILPDKTLLLPSIPATLDNFKLITYAKYKGDDAPWQKLNVQTPGNCQFRAILFPLLWKLYDMGGESKKNDITQFNSFNEWYNKVKFYETMRAFYIIYKYNLITLKHQNIFNELLISYEKLLKKDEIKNDTDIQKNMELITNLKREINKKFIKFLSGIKYNSKESSENQDGVLDLNIFNSDTREYIEQRPNKNDNNIFIELDDLKNKLNIIDILETLSEYCKKITNVLQENKIADEDLHKLGNYYILTIENNIDYLHENIIDNKIICDTDSEKKSIKHLGDIIEKYIDIRSRVPVFSHQFDQSPLYCMGILQILGKIINSKLPEVVPELHKSLLLERIASAVPLAMAQKEFYDRLAKDTNMKFCYDFLMLNDNDQTDNEHLLSEDFIDMTTKLDFIEILYSKCFVFFESRYITEEYNEFKKLVLDTITDVSDKDKFEKSKKDHDAYSYSIRILRFYNEKIWSNNDNLYKQKVKKNLNYSKFEHLPNIIKIIHICNLPSIAPIGFTKYNISNKYSYLNNDYKGDNIQQTNFEMIEGFHKIPKNNITLKENNILIFTDYSCFYFSYLYSYFINNLENEFTLFTPKYKNIINELIDDKNKFTIASGGKVLNEINILIQESEFDKNYDINYKKLCENCESYGPLIYQKLTKVNPFIPDNIKVSEEDYTKITNTITNHKSKINNERLFMLHYIHYINNINNINNLNNQSDFTLSEIKNCISYNRDLDIFKKDNKNFTIELNETKEFNKLKTPLQNCMKIMNKDEKQLYLNIDDEIYNNFDEFSYQDLSFYKTFYGRYRLFEGLDNLLKHMILISTNLFFERLKWYETYDILCYSKYITNKFYTKPLELLSDLQSIKIKLNPIEPIYNKILSQIPLQSSIKQYKLEDRKIKDGTNDSDLFNKKFIKNFTNDEYKLLYPSTDKEIYQSILINNILYGLTKFVIKTTDNYILMYDHNNKILLKQIRNKHSIEYEIYKFNFQYSLFELIYKHTNNLKSLFYNLYLVHKDQISDTIYESSELVEAPFYLNDYYYWKLKKNSDNSYECTGHLIDQVPYYIKDIGITDYDIIKKNNSIYFKSNINIKMLDIFNVFQNGKGLLLDFLIKLSNCVDLAKIIIIETSINNYNIFIDNQTLNKKQIKFIVEINDDKNKSKVFLQDKTMEIILSNKNDDYKISRFFRFVAGLSNTFLICEKKNNQENNEENFKILSFPSVKIKRKQKDYVCNTIDLIPYVGYAYDPTIHNYIIKFKYNNSLIVDLNLFDLHYSGLYISNFNKDNLNNALLLICNYLYQDKIDIGRQLISQIYNLIYTFSFIEKMNILFNMNNLNTLFDTHWNYSYVLLDKLKMLSLWCTEYNKGVNIINNKIPQIKDNLSKGILSLELLKQDNINIYITDKFINMNDTKFILPKFLFLYKNSINIPFNINHSIKLKIKNILIDIIEENHIFSKISHFKINNNYNSCIYFIWDALFIKKNKFTIKDTIIENTDKLIEKLLYYNYDKKTLNKISNSITSINISIQFNTKLEPSDLENSVHITNTTIQNQLKYYNYLIIKYLGDINFKSKISTSESSSHNLKEILIKKISTTNKSIELSDFKETKNHEDKESLDNNSKDINQDIKIDQNKINNIEKYLNKLIYAYCYDKTDDCYTDINKYNGNISNSIYNHICKLSHLGIKFITVSLFIQRLKQLVRPEPYKSTDEEEYIKTYNNIKLSKIDGKPKIILLYEFMMGYFINKTQNTYINNILHNLENNESRIYQIGMGVGKTSVLGPLISILHTQRTGKNIFNIMPDHLINDATKYYINKLSPYFPLNFKVLDKGRMNSI